MPGLNGRPSRKGPPPRAIPALRGGAAAPALIILAFDPEINKKLPSNTLPQTMINARNARAQCPDQGMGSFELGILNFAVEQSQDRLGGEIGYT